MKLIQIFLLVSFIFTAGQSFAQVDIEYKKPPQDIANIITAPKIPATHLSPDGQFLALFNRPNYPPIDVLAQPEEKLAGIRINPRTNGRSRSYFYNGLAIMNLDGQEKHLIKGLPKSLKIENISFSPNSKKIAFTNTKTRGIELWVVDIEDLQAKKLTGEIVNDALSGLPYEWLPSSDKILYKAIPEGRGAKPKQNMVPSGPVIQENTGEKAPVRTYQDLLKDQYDEKLFQYYTASQLYIVNMQGEKEKFGNHGIIKDFSISPDGNYILTETIKEPFSYIVPYYRFPFDVDIWNINGKKIKTMANIPLAENIPKGYSSCRKGPRSFTWRADAPASLYWTEALDDGDPKKEAEEREQIFFLKAPFDDEPAKSIKLKTRFGGFSWFNDELAVANEWWWDSRKRKVSFFEPGKKNTSPKTVFHYSWEDRYNVPGNFLTTMNENGKYVLLSDKKKKHFYLRGEGASPEGNKPFVDEFNIKTNETKRLWRSTEKPFYETPVDVVDISKLQFLTRRESKDIPPNYFIRDIKKDELKQITGFEHPFPQLKGIQKKFIKYHREDGLQLTAKLYLPKGYDKEKDGRLPVLMWAYPREYKSADAAGQVKDSPYRFIRPGWWSPLLWLPQGYAILDDVSMPVVGKDGEEPNNTFIQQLVANAEAAIDTIHEMGVGDTSRIAIGGHSYGAFMTANLLAHSNLFAAGIARSGAYNRTLTPFGFQNEERTFWEARDIYIKMSPFSYADQVEEPILLIHGAADNNSGTYLMQSERYYQALKGHGATVRFVKLPYESHSYRAKESILHMAWEMDRWLEKYVKSK